MAFVLGLVLAVFACGKDAGRPNVEDAGSPIDTEVMAFLSEARALHHQANLKEDTGDVAGATQTMDRLVRASMPHPAQKTPEVEEVLADAYARLAELRLKARDMDGALLSITEGLKHAPEPTYFRGHLLEVQGIIEEGRASDLADAGKKDEAAQARVRAMAILQDAVRVQEQVIGKALGGPDGGQP